MSEPTRKPNLYLRLLKWATRQEENFIIESLAVILETLLDRVPEVGGRMVALLTDGFIRVDADSASTFEIHTQATIAQGRPDVEFRTPDRLAVCEVKVESDLRFGQLEGYRKHLRTSVFHRLA